MIFVEKCSFCLSPVDFCAHSRACACTPMHSHAHPRSRWHICALIPSSSRWCTLPPVLMQEYRRENDKSHKGYLNLEGSELCSIGAICTIHRGRLITRNSKIRAFSSCNTALHAKFHASSIWIKFQRVNISQRILWSLDNELSGASIV